MKTHWIAGGSGSRIHLVETGKPEGAPILFIHGFSQCLQSWSRQLDSSLAGRYRLVGMDLRGHGLSDKPRDRYADSQSWADDIDAVIVTLGLDRPALCGWSYAPLVILDYVRHYGEEAIRGICFVGGVTQLGSEEAASVLTPEFLGLVPGFCSADVQESVRTIEAFLRICYATELADEDRYRMLGYNLSVPPHVRHALFSRTLDNDDLLAALKRPALIVQGADDRIVTPRVIDRQMSRIPSREVRMLPGAGHACFWDDARAFNRHLQDFIETL